MNKRHMIIIGASMILLLFGWFVFSVAHKSSNLNDTESRSLEEQSDGSDGSDVEGEPIDEASQQKIIDFTADYVERYLTIIPGEELSERNSRVGGPYIPPLPPLSRGSVSMDGQVSSIDWDNRLIEQTDDEVTLFVESSCYYYNGAGEVVSTQSRQWVVGIEIDGGEYIVTVIIDASDAKYADIIHG